MSLGPKSLRTTGLIKEINQQKRRKTTDVRHFINHTIYLVLREPSLDLLLIREYLTAEYLKTSSHYSLRVGLGGESGVNIETSRGIF